MVQAVGSLGCEEQLELKTPVWILPENVPLYQMFNAAAIRERILFDICIDETAADVSISDSDEDWETGSEGSQSVASLD